MGRATLYRKSQSLWKEFPEKRRARMFKVLEDPSEMKDDLGL